MEESSKDQQSSVASGKSKLRYPLRSASKLKDQSNKSPDATNHSASATSRRGKAPSSVSQSVGVLELSGKDKSAKPPRRLSIPAKSNVSPRQKTTGNITPISEARSRRSANIQERCETPLSDISKSSTRRKFNVLTSASYWLSQIKLSESAAKHSISLGFFKLALEAGCEPLQRLRDELKSYAQRHNLAEFGDMVKGLFESYELSKASDQMQVSETCSHVPEDATTPSDQGVHSTTSTTGTRKLKPKSLNTDAQASSAKVSSKKEVPQGTAAATRTRSSVNRNPVNARSATECGVNNIKKKVQKPGKQESSNGEEKIKKQEEKSAVEEDTAMPLDSAETLEGNKENMDAPLMEEISVTQEN